MPIWSPAFFGSGAGGASGYVVEDSIWFDGSADYLTKTFAGAGTSRVVYTVSFWAKPSTLSPTGGNNFLFDVGPSGGNSEGVRYTGSGNGSLYIQAIDGTEALNTGDAARFRDLTAWQHVVWSRNTGNADGDKTKLYVNGVRITAFDSSYGTRGQNLTADGNLGGTDPYSIGRDAYGGTIYYNGYLAEFAVIDGTEYAASDFGELDDNGGWVPVDPSELTYGDNGFLLQFKETGSGQDADGIGADTSGKDNHFAVGGGAIQTNQVTDTPTDDVDNDIGNYWTLTPLQSNNTLTNGNLAFTGPTDYSNYSTAPALPMTGKWYWEIKAVGSAPITSSASWDTYVGVLRTDVAIPSGSQTSNANIWVWGNMAKDGSGANGAKHNNSNVPFTPAVNFGDNSIMMIAVDMDNSKIYFGNDGTWAGSGDPAGNSNAAFDSSDSSFGTHQVMPYQTLYADSATYNFGATAFAHTPPTGFKALNTANLPAPTVTDPSKYFFTKTYTGDTNNNRDITGFQDAAGNNITPDWVWIKGRSNGTSNYLQDVARAFGGSKEIMTDSTNAEGSQATGNGYIGDVVPGGFTAVDGGTNDAYVNENSRTYVAWMWKAGGAASTIAAGSISTGVPTIASSVSAADHGGFSIVSYTANNPATVSTIGHGLSREPALIMVKGLSSVSNWAVYSEAIGGGTHYLTLEQNTAAGTTSTYWNDADATSSVFTIGTGSSSTNANGENYVAYCFANTPGMIASGTYIGNGDPDGPMVTVDDGASGFKPAWIMIKQTSADGNDWEIYDGVRDAYNPVDLRLKASAADAEASAANLDFTANGFKIRSTAGGVNTSTSTFLYLAFAERPFGGDTVAQARAR